MTNLTIIRGAIGMTTTIDISTDLMQLEVFAEREDWLYQAELRLADEFSRVALAFAETTPGAEVICKDYIGADSALRYRARSSLLRSINSIEKTLDKLQGLRTMYKLGESLPDYFASQNPAKAFLESEIRRRDLGTFWGNANRSGGGELRGEAVW